MLRRSPEVQIFLTLAFLWLGRLGAILGLPKDDAISAKEFVGILCLDFLILVVTIAFAVRLIRLHPQTLSYWLLSLSVTIAVFVSANHWVNLVAHRAKRPPLPPAEALMLETRGTVTYWAGPIDFDSFEALERTLQQYPQIKTLSLDSAGGRVPAARGMARLVSEARLDTIVSGTCSSACTLVFIAGEKRTLPEESRLGFHGYKLLSGIRTIDTEAEQLRDLKVFQKRGVDALFLEHAFSVPFEDIWFPDHERLRQSGVTN